MTRSTHGCKKLGRSEWTAQWFLEEAILQEGIKI
jgi:hypothetical protein